MDSSVLDALTPDQLRELLPTFLASRVEESAPERVQGHVAHWSDDDFASLLSALQSLGDEHRVYPAIAHCRALARAWMGEVLEPEVAHADRLRQSMDNGRTVIVTNHISYVDAVATDIALDSTGHPDLADRIIYLAGPKVYQEVFRLVAAASIHSLPVPQSNQVSQAENLSVRELARRAMTSLDAGKRALDDGYALLFYPEGSRTRTGRMKPFLQATRRYLKAGDFVVPAAIVGTDLVMPLESHQMSPGRVSLTFGEPIAVDSCESARDLLAAAHSAIAEMLPEARRPLPDTSRLV